MAKQGYDQFFNHRKQIARKTTGKNPSAMPKAIEKNGLRLKRKKPKKMKPMPKKPVIICALLLMIALLASTNEKQLIQILGQLDKVELQIFPKSIAQDAAKEEGKTAKKKNEKGSLDKFAEEQKAAKAAKKTWTQEEVVLFSALEDRKSKLDQKEEELKQLESELAKQRENIQAKLKELKKIREGISTKLEEQVTQDDARVNKLVDVYSNMKPPQAAKIMEKVDESLAIRILAKMKKKNAAAILNLLEPEKARRLSEKYVGYISMK